MAEWKLEFDKSKQGFDSVWSIYMHNVISREEFSQRMQEINFVVSQIPFPRNYITYCFTTLSFILLICSIVILRIKAKYLYLDFNHNVGYMILAIIFIVASIGSSVLIYMIRRRSTKKFENAISSHLNQLNQIYNPRLTWILENTSIKTDKVNIDPRHGYNLIIQTSVSPADM